MWKRIIAAVLFGIMLLAAMVGCGTSQAGTTPASGTTQTTASQADATTQSDSATQTEATATSSSSADSANVTRPEGWDEVSHGADAEPNYEVVFPDDNVNEITITISPENWQAMQADLTTLLGERGSRPQRGMGQPPAGGVPDANGAPPQGGPGGGFGGGDMTPVNPMWVPTTVTFNGETWTKVGVRYKGNSSLRGSWNDGTLKLPLKFDFDEFEDDYPEIENQRFYGFKQLSFANAYGDSSYMREAVTYDLLEEAGLVAANTAYYEIYLDYGEGPKLAGLYTAVEVIDDTVVERTFGDDSGNIYEAEGSAASFAEGTYDQIEDSFQKENNEDEADWSDIQELYNVLHSEERTTDPAAWRTKLEAVFDVDSFIEWLALSAMLQHWDTYGAMTHNYYLYDDPETDKLTWISWDHNFVLSAGPGANNAGAQGAGGANGQPPAGAGGFGGGAGGFGGPGGGFGGRSRSTSLDKANVGTNWPLIRYLLDDPTYYEKYINALTELNGTVFNADELAQQYAETAAMLAPYAAQEGSTESFNTAVEQLTTVTQLRQQAVADFLATQ